ncbi:hypothetical protein BGW41_006202 [Actinomortierella wolfii]|nr:hypothetical protein BGW41_006202 [Actinomortierella wolfii]
MSDITKTQRRKLRATDNALCRNPRPGYSGLSFYMNSKHRSPTFHDPSTPTATVATLHKTYLPVHPIREIHPEYVARAQQRPLRRLGTPQKPLIILDLNGTLFCKNKSTKAHIPRPFLESFNEFLFANFRVMVFSSARPERVGLMVEKGFGERAKDLDRVWSRDFFGLHEADYHRRVLTVKDLDYVWNVLREEQEQEQRQQWQQRQRQVPSEEESSIVEGSTDGSPASSDTTNSASSRENFGASGSSSAFRIPTVYDQTNTIIIDDSAEKTQLQPYNRILVKEFKGEQDDIALVQVMAYLKEAMYYDNKEERNKRHDQEVWQKESDVAWKQRH